MATFKAEVYAHQKKADGTYNIKIRVTHNKRKKYLATSYYVVKDDLTRSLKIKNQYYIDQTDKLIRSYRSICDRLGERSTCMNIEQIVDFISKGSQGDGLNLDIIEYGRSIAKEIHDKGHSGNASIYVTVLNNLVKFVGRERIGVQEITVRFINDWIKWIQEQPARANRSKGERAQSLYPSTLRAIHNRAKLEYNDEETGVIRIPLSPFKKIRLPQIPISKKRALDVDVIRKIIELEYTPTLRTGNNRFNLAKDVFLLSFALIGMNAVDLYNCTDCTDGRITYQRTKTKNRRADRAEISIKIEPEIMALVNKYKDTSGKRVFNFHNSYASADNLSIALSRGLKQVGEALNISNLEFYAARHSWATIAVNDVAVDKYVVHSALNHVDDKMRVTDIYIKKSWDSIDQANRAVLDYVEFKIK